MLVKEETCMQNFETMRTGKTGVAFGLIRSRDGAGDVHIIPYEADESGETPFPYLLGIKSRKDTFECLIGENVTYGTWAEFRRCHSDEMDIYYTKEARAHLGSMPIAEASYENLFIEEEHADIDDGYVFIRKVDPTTIECVVATHDEMRKNPNVDASRIYKLTLKG